MKRALVVKALTDQILLVRTDSGDLLSLSVPCTKIPAGSLLQLELDDVSGNGCVIVSIAGKNCRTDCSHSLVGMIIEHRNDSSVEVALATTEGEQKNVI